jgi:hypothetical protein
MKLLTKHCPWGMFCHIGAISLATGIMENRIHDCFLREKFSAPVAGKYKKFFE